MKRLSREERREAIQRLVSGELAEELRERVLDELAWDPQAADELEEAMQLRALGHELRASRATDGGAAGRRRRRRRQLATAGARAAAVAAVFAVIVLWSTTRGPGDDELRAQWQASLAPARGLLPRLSWPTADGHRPYDTARAGAPQLEALSLELPAKLHRQGDPRAIFAAQLLAGNPAAASAALATATSCPDPGSERLAREAATRCADLWSDRAALALVQGDVDGAIIAAAAALTHAPGHRQATWNRALALEQLGLDRAAAAGFAQLAALDEPGWSAEARERARALSASRARLDAARRRVALDGPAMVRGGPPPLDLVAEFPGPLRLYFYDAVRAAPTPARVRELQPMAAALDAVAGGRVLTEYVDRIAQRAFERRAPLAARYLALTSSALDAAQRAALVADLRAAREDDLLLGALTWNGFEAAAPAALAEYAALAQATGDPWFELLAMEHRATAALAAQRVAEAESILRAARDRCAGRALGYRCFKLAYQLSLVYRTLHRPRAARMELDRASRAAAEAGAVFDVENLLQGYAHVASQHDDRGAARSAIVRAYLDELERAGDCELLLLARDSAVMALVNEHRAAEARSLMGSRALACDAPFTYHRAFVLSHVVEREDRAAVASLREQIAPLRATAATDERALIDYLEGRLVIRSSPDEGRALLRRAIATRDPSTQAVKARSYSYASLIEEAGRRRQWAEVLQLLGEERRLEPPRACTLGIAEEELAVFVAADPAGALVGTAVPRAIGAAVGQVAVPGPIREVLRACPEVDVIARQGYHGRADLLPRTQVWRFRTRPASAPAGLAPGALVIGDITPPKELRLPELAHLAPAPAGTTALAGAQASPARVLAAMRDVGFIEIHGHGITVGDDAAELVLSPDTTGNYALTAAEIAAAQLGGDPIVALAACHAGAPGLGLHSTWGLPEAFLDAGARAVIASAEPILDATAQRFFAALRGRLLTGVSPAQALRDERMAWTDPAQLAWIDRLVIFQ